MFEAMQCRLFFSYEFEKFMLTGVDMLVFHVTLTKLNLFELQLTLALLFLVTFH